MLACAGLHNSLPPMGTIQPGTPSAWRAPVGSAPQRRGRTRGPPDGYRDVRSLETWYKRSGPGAQMVMIRETTTLDLPFLEEMLYEAFFWSGGPERPTLVEMRTRPEFSILLADWGRDGDAAFLARSANARAGASWFRLWTPATHSYGFVDHEIPELGLAVAQPFRGQGIGRKLLRSLIKCAGQHAYPGLSLSVAPGNPARQLYESEGFRKVGEVGTSWTMLRELPK